MPASVLSAVTVFFSWAYLFVVESTRTYWQSHYYLEVLVTFLPVPPPAPTITGEVQTQRLGGHPATNSSHIEPSLFLTEPVKTLYLAPGDSLYPCQLVAGPAGFSIPRNLN